MRGRKGGVRRENVTLEVTQCGRVDLGVEQEDQGRGKSTRQGWGKGTRGAGRDDQGGRGKRKAEVRARGE